MGNDYCTPAQRLAPHQPRPFPRWLIVLLVVLLFVAWELAGRITEWGASPLIAFAVGVSCGF